MSIISKVAAPVLINSMGGSTGKKKRNTGCLIGIVAAIFILLMVVIVIGLMSMPFAGLGFFAWLKLQSQDVPDMSLSTEQMKDPWSNKDFVEDVLNAIDIEPNRWNEVLAAMQARRMLYPEGDTSLEEALQAVLGNSMASFVESPPSGQTKPEMMQPTEAQSLYDFNKRMVDMQLKPFIGQIRESQIIEIPLGKDERVEDFTFDENKTLTYYKVYSDGRKELQPSISNVISYKVFSNDISIARTEVAPEYGDVGQKFAGKLVVAVSSDLGNIGVSETFPVPEGFKYSEIVSVNKIMMEQAEGKSSLDISLDPQKSNMGTFIKTDKNCPIVVSENVRVLEVLQMEDGTFSVICESAEPERLRRYRYDLLKTTADTVKKGAFIPASGPIGIVSDYEDKGIFEFRTYINALKIFLEDATDLNIQSFQINSNDPFYDPAEADGFIEVDSYKITLLLEKYRIRVDSNLSKDELAAIGAQDQFEVIIEEKGG